MTRGDDEKPNAEPTVHHLDDGGNYIQVCKFSNFIIILLNCITNDLLQQGYTP
jgi:hypothetical protein